MEKEEFTLLLTNYFSFCYTLHYIFVKFYLVTFNTDIWNLHDVSMLHVIGQWCLLFAFYFHLFNTSFFLLFIFFMFLALLLFLLTLRDVKVQVVVVMYFEPLGVFLSLPSTCVCFFWVFLIHVISFFGLWTFVCTKLGFWVPPNLILIVAMLHMKIISKGMLYSSLR